MSCPALTNKGGKLYISEGPVDCDLTLSELAVLDYVFVPGVGSIGDTGIDQDVVTYPTTDAGLTAQGKGDAVARNWDIEVLDAPSQARDILDEASAIGNDDNYATRIEWPNGDVEFSIVQVASRTAIKGAASGVRVIRYTMVPSFIPIVTNSLPFASNVVVSGDYVTGETLTATYDYYSPLGLPESGSVYQWYANGAAIPGADGLTYVIDVEYEGQMISFGVIPSDGLSEGDESVSAAGGPVFAPESVDLFSAMTPAPSEAQKIVINNFMRSGLIPLWAKMDGFYILHSYAEQPSLINWRSPSEEAVPEGDPQFIPFSGWAGDGVGAYISIPTALSSYTQNSAHYGSAQAESIAGAGTFRVSDSGDSLATRLMFYNPRSTSNFINMRINSATSLNSGPYGDDTALAIVDRSNDDVKVYQNGSEVFSQVDASSGLPTMPFILLNSKSVFSEATINFFCFGGHLTAQESADLSQAWLSYLADMQEIGAFSLEDGDGLLLTEGGDEIGTEGV